MTQRVAESIFPSKESRLVVRTTGTLLLTRTSASTKSHQLMAVAAESRFRLMASQPLRETTRLLHSIHSVKATHRMVQRHKESPCRLRASRLCIVITVLHPKKPLPARRRSRLDSNSELRFPLRVQAPWRGTSSRRPRRHLDRTSWGQKSPVLTEPGRFCLSKESPQCGHSSAHHQQTRSVGRTSRCLRTQARDARRCHLRVSHHTRETTRRRRGKHW